jgi:hypothetical protein
MNLVFTEASSLNHWAKLAAFLYAGTVPRKMGPPGVAAVKPTRVPVLCPAAEVTRIAPPVCPPR